MTKLEWVRLLSQRELDRRATERAARLTAAVEFFNSTICPPGCSCKGTQPS